MIDKKNKVKITEKMLVNGNYVCGYTYMKWDPILKKTIDDRMSIGKICDDDSTCFYPNNKYYELYNIKKEVPKINDTFLTVGPYLVLKKIADDYGITNALQKTFENKTEKILALAIFLNDSSSAVSQHYGKWSFSHFVGLKTTILPSHISELYKEIGEQEQLIESFQKHYIKKIKALELINETGLAFDSTNFSTTSTYIDIAEYGHSKKADHNPIINTAILVGEENGIPYSFETFMGSILDKSEFPFSLKKVKNIGMDNLFFVLDRGYFSQKNLKLMNNQAYLSMVPATLSSMKNAIKDYKDVIINKIDYYIEEENVYGIKLPEFKLFENFKTNAFIFYDSDRASKNTASILSKITYMKQELSKKVKLTKTIINLYGNYFSLKQGDKKIEYELNKKHIQDLIDKSGLFMVVSNRDITAREAIMKSRQRDKVEKSFSYLKSYLGLDTLNIHKTETFKGKLFIAYIALVLNSIYRYKTKGIKNNKAETVFTEFAELNKIVANKNSSNKWGYTYALNKKQKNILNAFNISSKDLNDIIKNLNKIKL